MTLREWFREWSGLAQDARTASIRERFIVDALGKLSGQIEKKQEPSLRPPTPRPPVAPVDWEQASLQALYDLESDPKKGN